MITLFTAPKPFVNAHIRTIQINAIRSWQARRTVSQIVLLGEEEGMAEVAAELGVQHIPEIAKNEHGTPLIDDIFARGMAASAAAGTPLTCYIKADIILPPEWDQVAETLPESRFLAVGHRYNLDITESLSFDAAAEAALCERRDREGTRLEPVGMDFFLFRESPWERIPPFALGRTIFDNWLVHDPCRRGIAVIDVTPTCRVIHQNHDYGHTREKSLPAIFAGEEALENKRLAGMQEWCRGTVYDATYVLRDGQVVPAPLLPRLYRQLRLRAYIATRVMRRPFSSGPRQSAPAP